MMTVIAITPIQFGLEDGKVDYYDVGDDLSSLDEASQESLVQGGSAIETGKNRKFSAVPGAAGPVDEATLRRDALIARASATTDEDEPKVLAKAPVKV